MATQLIDGRFRGETDAGLPLVGGLLYTYASGTTTPKAAYTDATLQTTTTNPLVLNARGEAQVWLGSGAYSLKLTDAAGVTVWTVDGIAAADTAGTGQAAADALRSDLASSAAGKGADLVMTSDGRSVSKRLAAIVGHYHVGSVAEINAVLASTPTDGAVTINTGASELTIGQTIDVPPGIDVTFTGRYLVTSAIGIRRVTTDPVAQKAKYPIRFKAAKVRNQTAGSKCVFVNIAWQDSSGSVTVDDDCSFYLTGGSIGISMGRGFFWEFGGRWEMDSASYALHADASEVVSGWSVPSCPMNITVRGTFSGGNILKQSLKASGSPWHSIEGFTMTPESHSYASKLSITDGNGIQILSQLLESAATVMDSCFNSTYAPSYADRNTNGAPVLTVKTTVRPSQGMVISPGVVTAQGTSGALILFTDAGASAGIEITGVSFGAGYLCGNGKDALNPVYGVEFDHAGLRNFISDGAQTFQAMSACYKFSKPLYRSTIKKFEARDVNHYAKDFSAVFSGNWDLYYNDFRCLYNVLYLDLMVPNYVSSGVVEPVYKSRISHDEMMRAPVAAITAQSPTAGGFTVSVPVTYKDGFDVWLNKPIAAPGGQRGGATATVALDAMTWIAPR